MGRSKRRAHGCHSVETKEGNGIRQQLTRHAALGIPCSFQAHLTKSALFLSLYRVRDDKDTVDQLNIHGSRLCSSSRFLLSLCNPDPLTCARFFRVPPSRLWRRTCTRVVHVFIIVIIVLIAPKSAWGER